MDCASKVSSSSTVIITAIVYSVCATGCLVRLVVLARSTHKLLIAGITSSVAGVRTLLKKPAAFATQLMCVYALSGVARSVVAKSCNLGNGVTTAIYHQDH